MTAKRKPAKRAPVVTAERIKTAWHNHPKITLATIGALLTTMTAIGPFAAAWLSDFVRRAEFDANRRIEAWRYVETVGLSATAARNRVNDCDILRDKGKLSDIEKKACAQYQADLDAANRRINDAVAEAKSLSKGDK